MAANIQWPPSRKPCSFFYSTLLMESPKKASSTSWRGTAIVMFDLEVAITLA
jgi:hypothetical protein